MSPVHSALLDDPNPPSPGLDHRREVERRARQLGLRRRARWVLALASALAVAGAGAGGLFGFLPPHQRDARTSTPRGPSSPPKSVETLPRQSPSAPRGSQTPSGPAPLAAPLMPFHTVTYGNSNGGQLVPAILGGWLEILLSAPPGARWGQASRAGDGSGVLWLTAETSDASGGKRFYFKAQSTGTVTIVVPCSGAACTTAIWRLRVYVSPTWPPPRGWRLNSYPGCWTAQQKGGTTRYC